MSLIAAICDRISRDRAATALDNFIDPADLEGAPNDPFLHLQTIAEADDRLMRDVLPNQILPSTSTVGTQECRWRDSSSILLFLKELRLLLRSCEMDWAMIHRLDLPLCASVVINIMIVTTLLVASLSPPVSFFLFLLIPSTMLVIV